MSVPDPATPSPLLLGIRHHGPGSARAVRRALTAYRPDIVLIEGPPEADALVALAGSAQMRPPVALLAYRPPGPTAKAATGAPASKPGRLSRTASFWPFAEFSPEWQAIRWAVAQAVPVRFMDLPVALRFGRTAAEPSPPADRDEPIGTDGPPDADYPADNGSADKGSAGGR